MEVVYPWCRGLDVHKSLVIVIDATQVASVLSHRARLPLRARSRNTRDFKRNRQPTVGGHIADKK